MKTTYTRPSIGDLSFAKEFWKNLSQRDLEFYHRHYTTGEGRGMYSSVSPTDTFDEFLVNSAYESHNSTIHDS